MTLRGIFEILKRNTTIRNGGGEQDEIANYRKMNIILHIIAFALCIAWFHQKINAQNRKLIIPVISIYLVATMLIAVGSLMTQAEYLDGIHYFLTGGVSLFIFWVWTTVVIIQKSVKNKNRTHLISDLAQNILLLIIPLLIWVAISNMSLKIGG